ncbi:FecR family protein [soil metagenome]
MTAAGGADQQSARIADEAAHWLAQIRGGAADQAAFEDWFSADPAHADAYESVLASWEASMSIDRPSAVHAAAAPSGTPARGRARYGWAALAAGMLIALFAFGPGELGRSGGGPAAAIALASKVGEIRTFRLADGSTVVLDTSSALSGTLTARTRNVRLLRGRARFDVAALADRPFVVETQAGSVTATGTVFDVGLDGSAMTVGTLRGAVVVRRANSVRRVLPGQILTVASDSTFEGPRLMRASETRWTTGMLSFENARLADVIATANRYGIVKIAGAADIGDLRFTGTIRPTRTDALAHVLAETFGLALARGGEGSYILSRQPG